MNQEDTAFIELLKWVTNQKNIPLKVRQDFIGHLQKVGYVDDLSRNFIEQHLQLEEARLQAKEKQLAQQDAQLMNLGTAAHNKDVSLKSRVVQEAEALINGVENHFVSGFKTREKELVKAAEMNTERSNQDEVAAIKASL